MTNRTYTHPTWLLVLMSIIAVGTFWVANNVTVKIPQQYLQEKTLAAECMNTATAYIRKKLLEMDPKVLEQTKDPNKSGLIGPQQTLITTDTGILRSKLTATNPNYAALVVELLKQAQIRRRDLVAASMTGSMPGLNIATWCAFEALDVEPLVISSVGASNYGATWPHMTWLDMENLLHEGNVLKRHSVAGTIGGNQDNAQGLTAEGKSLMEAALLRSGLKPLKFSNVIGSIQARMDRYNELASGRPIRAYVNVGGGIASLGSNANRNLIQPGLNMLLPNQKAQPKGVAFLMNERKIPVIQLLDTVELAQKFGMPVAPTPLPAVGEGGVFNRALPQQSILIVALGFLMIVLVVFGRLDIFTKIFLPKLARKGQILGESETAQKGIPGKEPDANPKEETDFL